MPTKVNSRTLLAVAVALAVSFGPVALALLIHVYVLFAAVALLGVGQALFTAFYAWTRPPRYGDRFRLSFVVGERPLAWQSRTELLVRAGIMLVFTLGLALLGFASFR